MVVASAMQGLCGVACTVSSVVHESPSSSSSAVLLKPFVTRPGIAVSIGNNNNNFFCTETFWRFDVGRGGMTMASLTAAAGSKLAATTPPLQLLHQIGTTTLGSRRRYNIITAAAASIAEARPLFRVLRLGTGPRSIPEQQQALLPCSLLRKKSSSRCFFARNKAIAEDDDDLVQVVNDGGDPPTPVNSCFLLLTYLKRCSTKTSSLKSPILHCHGGWNVRSFVEELQSSFAIPISQSPAPSLR